MSTVRGVTDAAGGVRYGTATGWWVIAATSLGAGLAYLDATVVNAALPAIDRDLHAGITGQQWIVNSYLVTLSALILLGGAIGDRVGLRRVFVTGVVIFTAASVLCGLAPSTATLVVARAAQGMGAALSSPGSLALVSAAFHRDDRGRAIGMWSGCGSIASAIGPFVGGWLIDVASWRWVFLINLPVAAVVIAMAVTKVPEVRSSEVRSLDLPGAAAISAGLGALSYGLIEGRLVVTLFGIVAMAVFLVIEHRSSTPMVPLSLFRSPAFSGTNIVTFTVWGAMSASTFFVVQQLQRSLGYSALLSGAALVPTIGLLALLSARLAPLSHRFGAAAVMSAGSLLIASGMLGMAFIGPGDHYGADVLPWVVLFGLGLAVLVAPVTATVLGAVGDDRAGVASAVNTAVARIGSLMAVAVLPGVVGFSTSDPVDTLTRHFKSAQLITAAICAAGALAAAITLRQRVSPVSLGDVPPS
jgi:EmrB/QacA subfamily drug resistance transporter